MAISIVGKLEETLVCFFKAYCRVVVDVESEKSGRVGGRAAAGAFPRVSSTLENLCL